MRDEVVRVGFEGLAALGHPQIGGTMATKTEIVRSGGLAPPPDSALALLRLIPEEDLWLEGHRSANTRRAYRTDVADFMRFLKVRSPQDLRQVERAAVLAWLRYIEKHDTKPSTIRRKLSALSSLFAHLVEQHVIHSNPVRDIRRPKVNRRQGMTPAFSQAQARAILDAPPDDTVQGLRDRAILSVGFQAGPRRSSITQLKVRDFLQDSGLDCLRFRWKGGHDHVIPVHPHTAQRIRAYLEAAGHAEDLDGPLFRPLRPGPRLQRLRRPLGSEVVDQLVKKYAKKAKVRGRFSAHSMRATFITVALENGASLEEVQRAAGHADPDTTKLYDRRGFNPEKAATFFASY